MAEPKSGQRRQLEEGLREVLAILSPYLPDVVLIGGWVPELYRRYGGLPQWQGATQLTREADVLLPGRILNAGKRPPVIDLLHKANLQPVEQDAEGAAIWRDPAGSRKIEFLVPHTLLKARPITGIAGQPGLAAIALRDVEILQRFSQTLDLPGKGKSTLRVRVPRLGAWVVNKASTFADRPTDATGSEKRSKDLAYLYDIMIAGQNVATRIEEDLRLMSRDEAGQRALRTAVRRLRSLLRDPKADVIQAAAAEVAETHPQLDDGDVRSALVGRLTDLAELLETAMPIRTRRRRQR